MVRFCERWFATGGSVWRVADGVGVSVLGGGRRWGRGLRLGDGSVAG